MSLSRKVFFNAGSQFIGKIANTVIGLLSVAIITRYLGVAGYGEYTTAFAYIMFFSVISDFGFFWVIVRKISSGEKIKDVIQNAQGLRLIFASGVLVASLILVSFLPYSQQLKMAVIMVAISIFWMGQNGVYLALFQSQLQMQKTVVAETIGRLISLGLVLLAITQHANFIWIVAAGLSATLFNYVFNLIFSLKFSPFGFQFNRQIMSEIFKESLPIGVVTILALIYFKIDTVLLSILKPSIDVGIYGTAYKILEILMALPIMFVGSVFPAIAEAFSQNNQERLNRLIQKSFDILSIGSFGIAAFFIGFARPTIQMVAGVDYANASTVVFNNRLIGADNVLQILVIAVALSFWSSLFTNALITFKKQGKLLKPYLVATIFNVAANLILIPRYSYLAAAVTTVLTELIILIFTGYLINKHTHSPIKFNVFWNSALAGLIILVITIFGHDVNFFIMVGIAGLVYLLLLYATKAFNKDVIGSLIGKNVN